LPKKKPFPSPDLLEEIVKAFEEQSFKRCGKTPGGVFLPSKDPTVFSVLDFVVEFY
jgi:hypothetical protein